MNFSETKANTLAITDKLFDIAKFSVRHVLVDPKAGFQKDLETLQKKIKAQVFTIGVVGGFNVGKSTFLNALLGQELLSTKILPETAAITRLNYGEETKATVHFWTKDEWDAIENQGKSEDEENKPSKITKMVDQVKTKFGGKFDKTITENGEKIENIRLGDLEKYTSANAPEGYAKLVREVEILTNLEFCKENIQIVDTPGLNDPVQFREHITVDKFLPGCDMLVLLLQAKQPFTDYDKKFLEKQLKKGQLHKLFVIINQIDLLQGKETVESIYDFTRDQLIETFDECESETSAEIANQLEIYPLSAYQSVLNRTGQEAKMTDMETGVPNFEARLRQFLFEGERAQEIQAIWQKRLQALINTQLAQINDQLENLDKPIAEIETHIAKISKEFEVIEQDFKNAQRECERTICHFDTKYCNQVLLLKENIESLRKPIQDKALKKIDAFINDKKIWDVMGDAKKWPTGTLQPFIDKQLKEGVEKISSDAEENIKGFITEAVEDFERIYNSVTGTGGTITRYGENGEQLKIDDIFWKGTGSLLVAVGAGFAANSTIATLIAHYAYGLAGTFYITGPVGWTVGTAAGLVALGIGGHFIKNDIEKNLIKFVEANLPIQIDSYAQKYKDVFEKNKPALINTLHEMVNEPVSKIQRDMKQRQDNLNQLLEEKKSEEFDIQKKRENLLIEKNHFEMIIEEINLKAQNIGKNLSPQ